MGPFDPLDELWTLPEASASSKLLDSFDFTNFEPLSGVPGNDGAPDGSGSADAEADGDAGPKKKRQRIVHANFEHLGACDTCRKRRVKCVRLNPANPICEECKTREIECTQYRNGGLRYKPRARKRPDAGSGKSAQPSKEADSPSSGSDSGAVILSNDSAQGRLVVQEESSGVLASLMDTFLDTATFAIPVVNWANLRMRFERAGRRPSQLDPMTETLVLACIAFGAFATDHPLIIGHDAPRYSQLNGSLAGAVVPRNLSYWAKRRMPHCRQLVDKVVKLVDSRGLFRVSSPETAGALFMTCELLEFMGEYAAADPFVAGAVLHTVRMHEAEADKGNDLRSGIEWGLAIGDSFQAAVTGMSFMISDEQLEDLLEVETLPAPSLDLVSNAVFSADWTASGRSIGPFWAQLIFLNRKLARKIAVPLKKNKPVAVETLQEISNDATQLFHLFSSARDLSKQIAPMVPPHITQLQKHVFGADALSHFRALPLSVISTFMILAGHFRTWKDRRKAIYEVLGEGFTEDPEAAEVAKLDASIGANVVLALCTSAMAIKEFGTGQIGVLTTHLSILMAVQKNIDAHATVAVHLPCAEQGGPPSYPRALKIEVAQTFIDALRVQSWTWGVNKSNLADACQTKLDAFKASTPVGPILPAGEKPSHTPVTFVDPPRTDSNSAFWWSLAGREEAQPGIQLATLDNDDQAPSASATAAPVSGSRLNKLLAPALTESSGSSPNTNTQDTSPEQALSPDFFDFLTKTTTTATLNATGVAASLPNEMEGTTGSWREGTDTAAWLKLFGGASSAQFAGGPGPDAGQP